jgi:hypothetical protein
MLFSQQVGISFPHRKNPHLNGRARATSWDRTFVPETRCVRASKALVVKIQNTKLPREGRVERNKNGLISMSNSIVDDYGGDLNNVRKLADGNIEELMNLLTKFKGIGKISADIFLREMRIVWTEFAPFADENLLSHAATMKLPHTTNGLWNRANKDVREFLNLIARDALK